MIENLPVFDVDWPLEELWSSTLGFVTIYVTVVGVIGLASGSLTVSVVAAYTAFAYIALQTQEPLLLDILYVTLVVVLLSVGFKVVRTEVRGD